MSQKLVRTLVRKTPAEVDRRLAELALTREGLLHVVRVAHGAAAEATPFHPSNARGTFAYQYGIFALRDRFIGADWSLKRFDGLEMIQHETLQLRIGYTNVDIACQDDDTPKARSNKGAATERACQYNLFRHLPHYAPKPRSGWTTFFVMVDPHGAAELSQPILLTDNFGPFVERIYLTDGSEFDDGDLLLDDEDIVDDFDPQVVRKQ